MKVFLLLLLGAIFALHAGSVSAATRDSGLGFDDSKWEAAFSKAAAFVGKLTPDEKISIVTGAKPSFSLGCIGNLIGVERLGFKPMCLQDGPNGIARAELTSTFPAGITTAASWDKELIKARARALAQEYRAKGMQVMLGPVAGPLGTRPLGGRNWESFGPDPYLTGIAMDISIRETQRLGVQAVAKHFVGNEQETQRTNSTAADGSPIEAISSNIDDRTLHELYLWPFADSVRAGSVSIMCSYNRYNQTYACENRELLTKILRDELGFRGYVMSDWYATHSGPEAANAGLDMEMPGPISASAGASYYGDKLLNYIKAGTLTSQRLDQMAQRVMAGYYLLRQDEEFPSLDPSTGLLLMSEYGIAPISLNLTEQPARDVRDNHGSLIRAAGAAGTVLLKNTGNFLPLKSPKNIGVFGNDAADITEGASYPTKPGLHGYYYGTLPIGSGAGSTRQNIVVPPLEAIKKKAKESNARVQYTLSNEVLAANDFRAIYPTPDVCLVFLKSFAGETADRDSFEADWNSTQVVSNVAKRCPNTVVVTHSSGPNTMPWANNSNVKAILAAHYPGEETGNSIVDILWGEVNPSGKLPYTIPSRASDYDAPIMREPENETPQGWQDSFTDGLLVDYRRFDALNITPLYEFGFGRSYTNFVITEDLRVEKHARTIKPFVTSAQLKEAKKPAQGGHPDLWEPVIKVTTRVSNAGKLSGATVLQLYIALPPDSVPKNTPCQVLRGFEKVSLNPGESRTVSFEIRQRDLSYWDVEQQGWRIPQGPISLRVGFSSRDIKSTAIIALF